MNLKIIPIFFFTFFTFLVNFVSAQNAQDIRRKIQSASGTELIKNYLQIGQVLSNQYGYVDSLKHYTLKADSIANSNKLKNLEDEIKYHYAIYLQKINQYDSSSSILKGLINKNVPETLKADLFLNLGLNEYRINNNSKALDAYLAALKFYLNTDNRDGEALTYCRLAALFNNEDQREEAIQYLNKAKSIIAKIKEIGNRITVLSAITGIYDQLSFKESKFVDSSLVYAKMALDEVIKHDYLARGNQLCLSISKAYRIKHDSINALLYCKQASRFRNFLLPNEILINYIEFSDCYSMLGDYKTAIMYLDSIHTVVKVLNDPYYWMVYYERMYVYNRKIGNLNEAIIGLEKFKSIQDSIYNSERSTIINEMQQKYQKAENEREIESLSRKNEIASLNVKILIVAILAAVLVIVVIVFFYRQSVLKNKFKALETEQRLNRARMDPHFFFNALSSIQTLSMDEENNKKVPSLISKFSKIMRQSLESTYDELSTIEEEVSFLTNYLDIQKLRYNNKFDYEIKVDDNLEIDELKVLGMLLQPFIENAIEHGFKNIDYKGELKISFFKEHDSLKVELSDNGVGFNTEALHKEYPSRATQIISDRLMLLNKRHKTKAGYNLSKNPTGKGILVEVTLPILT